MQFEFSWLITVHYFCRLGLQIQTKGIIIAY